MRIVPSCSTGRPSVPVSDTVAQKSRRLRSAPGVIYSPGADPGEGTMIIDCHGHYTTSPRQHEAWRTEQIAAHGEGRAPPPRPAVSDDEIRASIVGGQLKLQQERGTDLTIFSPRAAGMGHHLGDAGTSEAWAAACNELIHRVCGLFPDNFIGVCMLPQSPGVSPKNTVAELERCVRDLGFVGCNLNPDPSGGYWTD